MESVTVLVTKVLKFDNLCFLLLNRPGGRLVTALCILKGCLVLSTCVTLALKKLRQATAFHPSVFQKGVTVAQESVLLCEVCFDNIELLRGGLKISLELCDILCNL